MLDLDHSQEGLLDIFDDKKQGILGFKAPDTFFYKKAHARLKKLVPTSTNFIVILWEPTSRALSHYWLDYAKGREPLSMEKAFNKEQERMEKSDYAKDHYSYKSRGFYHDNLKEWYKTFSKESTLVLILDDLKSQPEKEWKKIQAFLGVTKVPFQQVPKSNKNIAMIPRSSLASWKSLLVKYERLVFKFTGSLNLSNEEKIKWRKTLRYPFFKPIDTYNNNPSLRHNLLTAYLSDIEKLETLLNKDLNKWKSLN